MTAHDQDLNYLFHPIIADSNLNTIDKIIDNLLCPNSRTLYKLDVDDKRLIKKIINKWRTCTFPDNFDSYILSGLQSSNPIIVRVYLDYLVDIETRMPMKNITTWGSALSMSLKHFGLNGGQSLHDSLENAKHDAILNIYLEYYPRLKKQYGVSDQDYAHQSSYIISRIKTDLLNSAAILKLMIQVFEHEAQSYLEDLFKQCCANNNVPIVKFLSEVNPNFYAEIQDGTIVNYKVQNAEITALNDKIDLSIAHMSEQITTDKATTHLQNKMITECLNKNTKNMAQLKDYCVDIIKSIEHDHAATITGIMNNNATNAIELRDSIMLRIDDQRRADTNNVNKRIIFIYFILSIIFGMLTYVILSLSYAQ